MNRLAIFIFTFSLLLIVIAFSFRDELVRFESLGLLGIFLVNLIGSATLFLPAPAIASVVAGGVVYQPLWVALLAALGAALGDMIGFLLGHSSKEIFIKNHHIWYKLLKDLFHRLGFLVIIIFSFVPNPVFDFVGITAGLFKFPLIRFFILVFAGRLLRNLLLVSLSNLF